MAKKLHFLLLCLVGAAFTFVGCGNHDPYEGEINWDGDNGGTLEITNGSPTKDIVVFYGNTPAHSSIIGGARGGKTTTFDICKHVDDCDAGGYIILRGITKEQYEDNKADLNKAKVEFNAFATYKRDKKYRIQIDANYMGDYAVRLHNRGRVGLELRKDSPEGEKVAYLPALQQNQMLYTSSPDMLTLFPVYVFYDKSTQAITTINSTSMWDGVYTPPRPANDPSGVQNAYFPNGDPGDVWANILNSLKSPVAYITVSNGTSQGVYFTNAGSTRYYSQEGYNGIGGGEQLIFEVKAADEEETEGQGVRKNLAVMVSGYEVPIRFANDAGEPYIINGYNYTVSISGSGQDITNYRATIVKGSKRDLSKLLETL